MEKERKMESRRTEEQGDYGKKDEQDKRMNGTIEKRKKEIKKRKTK